MKKPDITDGKWKHVVNKGTVLPHRVYSMDNILVCYMPHGAGENNAKAISAVPEMIDALIEVYHLIQSLKHTSEWGVNVHPIDEENVKKALTKAGCQI